MTDPLFAPRGVAAIGASPKPSNIGGRVLAGLRQHGFGGDLAAVNLGHTDVGGTPCYPSVADVPFAVDLALICVGAARVVGAVEEAAQAGATAVAVYSSGFAEAGLDGQREQERLRQIADKFGVRVLGPNTQGLVDFRCGLAATFSPTVLGAGRDDLAPVAYVGQSGAVGGVFFDLSRERGVTPTAWVSTGNEVDLTVSEIGLRLLDAGPLDLLCLYLEQVPDGRAWSELAAVARDRGARIAVLRSGRTGSGQRAAASHTGALVGDDVPFALTCAQYGVAVVEDVADLVEIAVSTRAGSARRGRAVAVITTSGGAGGLAADQAEDFGMTVPVLGERTQSRLREVLPSFAAAENPVDVTADLMMRQPEDLMRVCAIVADDPDVDQVLLTVTNLVGSMADRVVEALRPTTGAPLSVAYLAAPDRIAGPVEVMTRAGIPVHPSVRAAMTAMAAWSTEPPGAAATPGTSSGPIAAQAGPDLPAGPVLTEYAATPLLDWIGITRPESVLVTDPTELPDAVAHLGGCAVLKVQSPDVLHKSEVGAVRVGVSAADAEVTGSQMLDSVRAAAPGAQIEGVLVQRLCGPGVELLVGVRAGTRGYPPTVSVGLGGTTVELYGDVATAFAPLDVAGAQALLRRLRGFPLLDGFRGRPPCDVDAAAMALARLSQVAAVAGLVELEVNPLVVHGAGDGVTAVDLLVRKEQS